MKKILLLISFLQVMLFALCDGKTYNNQQPKADKDQVEICYSHYGILYSTTYLQPMFTFAKLTYNDVQAAEKLPRKNSFHAEPSLPKQYQVAPSEFAGTGYDRGHSEPCEDMPTVESQFESFSMANMMVQNPSNNRGVWKMLEMRTRNFTKTGDIFVVNGILIDGKETKVGRMTKPNRMFKAVLQPSTNSGVVYIVTNDNNKAYTSLTISEFIKSTNINPFPGFKDSGKLLK
jgi:endonuclease G